MDSECVNCDDLARENDQLRARLAAVEALCDTVIQGSDAEHNARFGCETAGESDVLIDFASEVRAAAAGDDRTTPAEVPWQLRGSEDIERATPAAHALHNELDDELQQERARLAAVEAERDAHRGERHRLMKLISVRESAWEAAEARLAAVLALCDAPDYVRRGLRSVDVDRIRAAARGEGDCG